MKPTKINWNHALAFTLNFGPDCGADTKGVINVPDYGEYGGILNTSTAPPIDKLDALFKTHDQEITAVAISGGKLETAELVEPHANLIKGILALEEAPSGRMMVDFTGASPQGDAEGTLYGGFTIIALTADLVQYGLLNDLEKAFDPNDPLVFDDVPAALEEAWEYVAKAHSSGKPLNEAFDLLDNAFDELLARQEAPTSTSDWDFVA